MELARYLVDAVVVEKRTVGMWPAPTGSPRAGSQKLVARYKEGGYEAISARSKAAIRVANRSSDELDDRVVRLRKELIDEGFDAGAHTIHYHLGLTDIAAVDLDDLADPQTQGLYPSSAPQAPQELLCALRGTAPQRNVAIRRHLL